MLKLSERKGPERSRVAEALAEAQVEGPAKASGEVGMRLFEIKLKNLK